MPLGESAMINIYLDPVLFHWGPLMLRWHGVWHSLAGLAAYLVICREGRRQGISRQDMDQFALWVGISLCVCSRVSYVLTHVQQFALQPWQILNPAVGGWTFYGALIGGIAAALGFAWRKRIPLARLLDAAALAIPVAQVVGRVGCAVEGDVLGLPTHGPWGVTYWHPTASVPDALLGVPTVPVPILLQLWNSAVLGLLWAGRDRIRPEGALFPAALALYAIGRLIASLWQLPQPLLWGLSDVQVLSPLAIVACAALLLHLRARARKPHADAVSPTTGR